MSFGPPTRQLYFSWSNSRSSNVPFAASASTARGGRRRAGEADEGRTRRVARKLDLPRRLSEAPSVDAPEERARTRAARASRAGAEAASAARASGAVDIVPSQLSDGATRRRIFWPFLFCHVSGESCVLRVFKPINPLNRYPLRVPIRAWLTPEAPAFGHGQRPLRRG